MSKNVFPSGRPKTIIHPHDLKHVQLTPDGAYYRGRKIEGLIHAKVLVKDTFYPFLQFRAHGKSYCALCKKCVEEKNDKPCECNPDEKRYPNFNFKN